MAKTSVKSVKVVDASMKNDMEDDNAGTSIAIHKLIPNALTLVALLSGLTSIQMAFIGNFEMAVFLIVIAALFDILDGASARLLNAGSAFGEQLDSLSDFLCFGVAPAFILYTWEMHETGKFGWIATLAFACACAIRLARFNSSDVNTTKKPAWARGYFQGVAAPAGAGMAFLPIFIWFQAPALFESFAIASPLIGVWLIVVAALMISRIPTWSTKQLKIRKKMAVPALACFALALASLIHAPWVTLSVFSICYITSIFFAFRHFRKQEKKFESGEEEFSDLAIGAASDDNT